MGRIETAFSAASIQRPAFISFTVAGDPDRATCIQIARALIAGGTDILELGVPFSDPVADGPTIQKADERALASETTPDTVFEIVREIRKESQVPIVFLTYYNIVHHRGIERFYSEARDAGVDGILIADMPVEESEEVCAVAARHDIDPIFLITQTTSDERIKKIATKARGYLYLVAVLGVTGVRDEVSEGAIDLLHRVRKHTRLPLALGFGISTPAHAKTCARAGADGVIVGSAIVEIVGRNLKNPEMMVRELQDYVRGMKQAARNQTVINNFR
jgi:tryptophan synthase alpha chain